LRRFSREPRHASRSAVAGRCRRAEERGELIRGEAVETWLVRLLGAVVQRLRAIPAKAAPEVRATRSDAEGERLLADRVDEALQELADAMRESAALARRIRARRS
jgi:hypothetical protein